MNFQSFKIFKNKIKKKKTIINLQLIDHQFPSKPKNNHALEKISPTFFKKTTKPNPFLSKKFSLFDRVWNFLETLRQWNNNRTK